MQGRKGGRERGRKEGEMWEHGLTIKVHEETGFKHVLCSLHLSFCHTETQTHPREGREEGWKGERVEGEGGREEGRGSLTYTHSVTIYLVTYHSFCRLKKKSSIASRSVTI